jgi:hypothetical protein
MKTYDVVIQACVTKTIRVHAENEDQAHELAHESFSVLSDGGPEKYEQEALDICEVKEGEEA